MTTVVPAKFFDELLAELDRPGAPNQALRAAAERSSAVVERPHRARSDAAAADLRDLALVVARSAADTGRRIPLDEVLGVFGHTRESLAALPDND
ncbi:hypothetical protein [Dactylosporangium sp. CA-092794]|uniref:hypothetical protein n=1 Tax=Dactylosporangium sp. CA-092794 TaxID=3239929 RepID=UPI003D8A675C